MNLKFLKYIVVGFILTGCHKEKNYWADRGCTGSPTYDFPITSPDLINMKFKSGTYWVFTDSITNIRDSNFLLDPQEGHEYINHLIKPPAQTE